MALIKIENDLFFISNRLKEIDEGYFVAFNTLQKRFEIHNKNQPINTFCLVVPKGKLNASLVEYVRKTRIENQKKLILEMEEENEKLEKANNNKILEESSEIFEKELIDSKRRQRI